jgi:hypothetical protein
MVLANPKYVCVCWKALTSPTHAHKDTDRLIGASTAGRPPTLAHSNNLSPPAARTHTHTDTHTHTHTYKHTYAGCILVTLNTRQRCNPAGIGASSQPEALAMAAQVWLEHAQLTDQLPDASDSPVLLQVR